jgi:hypothetical protein
MRGSLCEPVGVLLVNIVRLDRWRAACHGVVHRAIRKLRRSRLYNAGILRQARSGTLPRSLQHKAGGPSTRLDSDGHASGLEGPVPGACVPVASPVAGSFGCWHFRREGLVEIRPAWHGPHATVHVMRPQAPVSHSPPGPAKPGQLMRARRARRRLGRRKAIWTRAHWARLAANGACCPVQSAVASHESCEICDGPKPDS